ncbi:MAG: hypothetical protein PWQ82_976 [Thermosediminibacterales bacterium]|nr:hypothetical protein [Thermosediminibacterales bacterium]MDK2835830.1 hypothetical protein [Thermosediminibacterales bacterium]
MATIVKMPKLGLTMTEGLITKWIKKEGEQVEKGEPLFEVQTDKVNLEEEAPASGILRKVLCDEGETVPILKPVAIIAEADEELPELENDEGPEEKNDDVNDENYMEDKSVEKTSYIDTVKINKDNVSIGKFGKIKASPAAKRIAKENKVDLYQITGTGENARITAQDVKNYIDKTLKNDNLRISPTAKKIAAEKGISLEDIKLSPGKRVMKSHLMEQIKNNLKSDDEVIEEFPLTGMRKIIADKMKNSVNEAPHFYLTAEVDMTSTISFRKKLNLVIKNDEDKISFNDLLIKVVAKALQNHRIINSRIYENKIQLLKQINIGLAVALDNGLIVPVIKDADKKSLAEIAKESKQLINKARNNKLTPDEISGGTFTISNLGMYDIINFTAIINQPESAILAVGKIQDRPIVTSEKQIEIRPMMNITLSSDHRIIDGAEGAKFLRTVKDILENPLKLLL